MSSRPADTSSKEYQALAEWLRALKGSNPEHFALVTKAVLMTRAIPDAPDPLRVILTEEPDQ